MVQCLVHNLAASVLSHVPSNLGISFTSDWMDHRWRFSPFWGWGVMSVYHAYTTRIARKYHAYTARVPRVYQKSLAYTTRIPRVYHAYTSVYQRIPAYTGVYHLYIYTKATVMMLHLFWLDRRLVITASRWKPKKLCKPHCYRGGPKKSDACAHARVSVYKRKSNFAFFKVEMAAFLLKKGLKTLNTIFRILWQQKTTKWNAQKTAPKETYKS